MSVAERSDYDRLTEHLGRPQLRRVDVAARSYDALRDPADREAAAAFLADGWAGRLRLTRRAWLVVAITAVEWVLPLWEAGARQGLVSSRSVGIPEDAILRVRRWMEHPAGGGAEDLHNPSLRVKLSTTRMQDVLAAVAELMFAARAAAGVTLVQVDAARKARRKLANRLDLDTPPPRANHIAALNVWHSAVDAFTQNRRTLHLHDDIESGAADARLARQHPAAVELWHRCTQRLSVARFD